MFIILYEMISLIKYRNDLIILKFSLFNYSKFKNSNQKLLNKKKQICIWIYGYFKKNNMKIIKLIHI